MKFVDQFKLLYSFYTRPGDATSPIFRKGKWAGYKWMKHNSELCSLITQFNDTHHTRSKNHWNREDIPEYLFRRKKIKIKMKRRNNEGRLKPVPFRANVLWLQISTTRDTDVKWQCKKANLERYMFYSSCLGELSKNSLIPTNDSMKRIMVWNDSLLTLILKLYLIYCMM